MSLKQYTADDKYRHYVPTQAVGIVSTRYNVQIINNKIIYVKVITRLSMSHFVKFFKQYSDAVLLK